MAQTGGALAGLTHGGKSFRQNFVEFFRFECQHLFFDAIDFDTGKFLLIRTEYGQIFGFGAG